MKRTILLIIILLTLVSLSSISSMVSAGSIVCSKHDFSDTGPKSCTQLPGAFTNKFVYNDSGILVTEVCVFCHTPHHASNQGVLWNRTNSSFNYTLYTSNTLSVNQDSPNPTGLTLMCMSCHDGVTSIAANAAATVQTLLQRPKYAGSVTNPLLRFVDPTLTQGNIGEVMYHNSGMGWGPNIGNYDGSPGYTTIDLSNDHPVSFPWMDGIQEIQAPTTLKLFGTSRRMECSTCHNVHNPDIVPFLAMSNENSAMCRQCHLK